MKKTLIALIVTALLTGCAKTTTYVPINNCAGFAIIKGSVNDTTPTLRQILAHNTTYRQLCTEDKSKHE
ncbi:hypothetical protein CEP76_03070 [[Haemophilus] ducreyi]|nr:hypothetical protein CEP76_03070 [[Haemophilus] ducreyi]